MIPFNFEYYKPDSLEEAVRLYRKLSKSNKVPLYYCGGTEIITGARRGSLYTKAVIDIKGIPECNAFEEKGNKLIIGAGVALSKVADSNYIQFISKTAGFPSDRSVRNKITVGGNICGKIIYKEALLGHLIGNSSAIIYGEKGKRLVPINQVFNQTLKLKKGEILVQLATDMGYSRVPAVSVKRTRQGKVGYPLISMSALKKNNKIRMAFSGVCGFPFRSRRMEEAINNKEISRDKRIELAIENLPAPILENVEGSAEFKKFVLRNLLEDTLAALDGEEI